MYAGTRNETGTLISYIYTVFSQAQNTVQKPEHLYLKYILPFHKPGKRNEKLNIYVFRLKYLLLSPEHGTKNGTLLFQVHATCSQSRNTERKREH